MISERLRRWANIFGFILAYLCIAFIGWAARSVLLQPYDGLNWIVLSGQVLDVDPAGPAYGKLMVGDTIVAVDGRPPAHALPLYSKQHAGDTVEFVVDRDGKVQTAEVELVSAPTYIKVQWMTIFLVSTAFWAGGVLVLAFAQASHKTISFFAWCLIAALALSAGALSPTGPSGVSALFNVLLWFSVPITIHFHLIFLEEGHPVWGMLLPGIYGLSLLGGLPFVIWGADVVRASNLFNFLYIAERLYVSFGFITAIVLLIHAYHAEKSNIISQRIRIVVLSTSVALVPIIVFNLLPDALSKQQFAPYEASLLFLIAIPMGYGYAIARHQLIRLDRFLNRGAMYTLVVALMAALYLMIVGLLQVLLPLELLDNPLVEVATALALGASFPAVRSWIQRIVDWAFYGGWYDYRSAVEEITGNVQSITEPSRLASAISERVRNTLRLQSAASLILGPFGAALGKDHLQGSQLASVDLERSVSDLIPENGVLRKYLANRSHPVETRTIRRLISERSLTKGEKALLDMADGVIWVPIGTDGEFLGLIILGPRLANETFHALDMDIMKQVSQHAAAVVKNLGLLHELRARAQEVERLNRQIVSAREAERRALSHELHDEVVQDLVGLTYKVSRDAHLRLSEFRGEIREIIRTVRDIIRRLRPPVLDNLGLVPALRGCVRDFREKCGQELAIRFRTNCPAEEWFPEDVAITAYRVLFESLNNILKHARAENVEISLERAESEILLAIQDDGIGFQMPGNLGALVMDRHFGLVTMRERLELIRGRLEIETAVGRGTIIRARIPVSLGDRAPVAQLDRVGQ
jgi:signal transduction histidine kinase